MKITTLFTRNPVTNSQGKMPVLCAALLGMSLVMVHPASAAFLDSGWGARPLGMGGAFSAVANDSNAPLFNPAGVAQIEQKEFSFMSARLFTGLDSVDVGLNYLGYIHPLSEKYGNVGITWASMSSPGLYREDAASISYGRFINDVISIDQASLAAGINLKYLRHDFDLDERTMNDPVFSGGTSAGAVTADLGLYAIWPRTGLSLGLVSKNITSPNVGLNTSDPVLNENVLGLAYFSEEVPFLQLPYFTAALDLVSRDRNLDCRVGLESWLFDGNFAVRLGGRSQELTLGLGYEVEVFAQTKLIMDYAFAWPLEVVQTSGSHRFALTLRFP